MKFCRKKIRAFKGKVRKKLKEKNYEIKGCRKYMDSLNIENKIIAEQNVTVATKAQIDLAIKDEIIGDLDKELTVLKQDSNQTIIDIEKKDEIIKGLVEKNDNLEDEKKDIKERLDCCNNRIKYEFNEG